MCHCFSRRSRAPNHKLTNKRLDLAPGGLSSPLTQSPAPSPVCLPIFFLLSLPATILPVSLSDTENTMRSRKQKQRRKRRRHSHPRHEGLWSGRDNLRTCTSKEFELNCTVKSRLWIREVGKEGGGTRQGKGSNSGLLAEGCFFNEVFI